MTLHPLIGPFKILEGFPQLSLKYILFPFLNFIVNFGYKSCDYLFFEEILGFFWFNTVLIFLVKLQPIFLPYKKSMIKMASRICNYWILIVRISIKDYLEDTNRKTLANLKRLYDLLLLTLKQPYIRVQNFLSEIFSDGVLSDNVI